MTTRTFSAVDVFAAVRRGQPSPGITEPRRIGCEHDATATTRGHAAGQGGLRGHSIDADTYPWRIVAGYWRHPDGLLLARWNVVGADGIIAASCIEQVTPAGNRIVTDGEACRDAHTLARLLKTKYPSGHRPANLPTLEHGRQVQDL